MKKFVLYFCFVFISSASIAAGPFIDDAIGDDAALPQGTIAGSSDVDLGSSEPMILADGADYIDVMNMDISGVMLNMPFEDVQTLFFKTKTLYEPRKVDSIIYTIANDWRYNLDYECRGQGIVIPEKLEKCILSLARSRGLLYPSELHLERKSTGETLDIYFTSNATDNKVWKVTYKNDVNELEGANQKFANQREKKILAFWQSVLEKYGAPNSDDGDKWISSDNSFDPKMQAFYGKLEMTDIGITARDAAENVKNSKENFKPKPYSF